MCYPILVIKYIFCTGGQHIGQNLAQESSSKDVLSVPDLVGMMNSWFSEVYKFGYNGTFTFDSGHYSQVCTVKNFKPSIIIE